MLYDCHAHILNIDYVPDECVGIDLPFSKKLMNKISNILHNIWPFSDDDYLDNISAFEKNMSQTQEENYIELASKYPYLNCICIVQMDFYSVKGNEKIPYEMQLLEGLAVRNKFGRDKVKLFMGIDPNTPYYDYLIEKYIDIIDGVKIYPPLNSIPTHDNFNKLWQICEKKQIPVTAHCGPNAAITAPIFRNPVAAEFANPKNWRKVLEKYPLLKVNLAHFGSGDEEWEKTIISLMYRFPSVYTDTAYSIATDARMARYRNWLDDSVFRRRLLFGSDYFISNMENKSFEKCLKRAKDFLGDDGFVLAAIENPRKFLTP